MFTTKLHRSEAKPQSLNRYAYVQNDPVNFVDPSGLVDDVIRVYTWAPAWSDFPGTATRDRSRNDPPRRENPNGGGGGPQNPYKREEPDVCAAMARTAQTLANTALEFWGNAKDALGQFDISFSRTYLGNSGTGRTYASAWEFNETVRGVGGLTGVKGFRQEFHDGEGDQTHHFAAHLSAGINNQLAAHNLQKLTDTLNRPDRLLSNAAYKIGQDLRKDPRNLFNIGKRILKDICASQ